MLSKKRRMSPVRTVYVPRFGSQMSSSQIEEEPRSDRAEPPSQCLGDRRVKKREIDEKARFLLKVKLSKSKKTAEEDVAPRELMLENTANETKTTESRRREQLRADIQSDSVGGDVFYFSEKPSSNDLNDKEKGRLSVLRTIARMLEENQLIRERVIALSQTKTRCVD